MWAVMERRKLDRIMKSMFIGNVRGKGKGPIISSRTHLAEDIITELKKDGEVILYADNTFKTKGRKKHYLPSHYISIRSMTQVDNSYFITYWDYGAIKSITLKKRVFERAARGYTILELDNLAYHIEKAD